MMSFNKNRFLKAYDTANVIIYKVRLTPFDLIRLGMCIQTLIMGLKCEDLCIFIRVKTIINVRKFLRTELRKFLKKLRGSFVFKPNQHYKNSIVKWRINE